MESMTMWSPRRARIARVGERLTGVAERPDALEVGLFVAFLTAAFLAVVFLAVAAFLTVVFLAVVAFLAVAFLAVAFLAVVLVAVVFLAVALLAVVFLAVVFLVAVFFTGTVASLTLTLHSAYFFALRGSRPSLALHAATGLDVSPRQERS